ncbi:MAG: hypothetical protein WDM81_06335 [Rhizomicrobium sp.]
MEQAADSRGDRRAADQPVAADRGHYVRVRLVGTWSEDRPTTSSAERPIPTPEPDARVVVPVRVHGKTGTEKLADREREIKATTACWLIRLWQQRFSPVAKTMLPYAFKKISNQSMRYMPAFRFVSSEPASFALIRKRNPTMVPARFRWQPHRRLSKAMSRQSLKYTGLASNDIAFILRSELPSNRRLEFTREISIQIARVQKLLGIQLASIRALNPHSICHLRTVQMQKFYLDRA